MSLSDPSSRSSTSIKRLISDSSMSNPWSALTSDKARTTVLINLAGIMERMDEQILPALYNPIGQSFHATPSQLGTLTLCRALVQALSSPVGGLSGEQGIKVHSMITAVRAFVNILKICNHQNQLSSEMMSKQPDLNVIKPSKLMLLLSKLMAAQLMCKASACS